MIYNENINEYRVKFYLDLKTKKSPALEYIKDLPEKEEAKVLKYIEFLRINEGYLDEPYSKHISGKIRELRIDFDKSHHRILYFVFIKKTIIILHAFLKKTAKTPVAELNRAEGNYQEVLKNQTIYE